MADFTGLRLLVFRMAQLVCAIEVTTVREITAVQPATRIPGAAPAVQGLINVRGELVTLVDGPRLLGGADADDHARTLLLDVDGNAIGLIVDEVLDLISLREGDLTDRDALPGIDPGLVRAVGRREGRAFVLLDLEALLQPILTS